MAKSMLDRLVEVYLQQIIKCNPATVEPDEMREILNAVKASALADLRDEQVRQMKQEAKAEIKRYRKAQLRKVRTSIIIETIILAFLVGVIVNQATNLMPENVQWQWFIIIACLIACIFVIWLAVGKD